MVLPTSSSVGSLIRGRKVRVIVGVYIYRTREEVGSVSGVCCYRDVGRACASLRMTTFANYTSTVCMYVGSVGSCSVCIHAHGHTHVHTHIHVLYAHTHTHTHTHMYSITQLLLLDLYATRDRLSEWAGNVLTL